MIVSMKLESLSWILFSKCSFARNGIRRWVVEIIRNYSSKEINNRRIFFSNRASNGRDDRKSLIDMLRINSKIPSDEENRSVRFNKGKLFQHFDLLNLGKKQPTSPICICNLVSLSLWSHDAKWHYRREFALLSQPRIYIYIHLSSPWLSHLNLRRKWLAVRTTNHLHEY